MLFKNRAVLTLVLIILISQSLPAVEQKTVSITDSPPVVDGKLDDPVWTTAIKFDGFKTIRPDYGKDPSQKTEVFMTYDEENIYFGVRCYDTEPSKIKAAVSKRDDIFQDDVFGIVLDTFNDMQGGFGFLFNPLGIQGDGMLDINGSLDPSHDMVWYSKGQIDDKGFTVECRIPLQSIRFPDKETITMRVLFFRFFIRSSEQASFPPLDPEKGSVMGQSQPIQVSGLKYKRVIELLPAVVHSNRKDLSGGTLKEVEDQTEISLTGKIGITSDLTMDAAYNPDFSQVEADAGQVDVNLRYELFFQEKRPFFLEGNDLWRFGGAFEEAPLAMIVHTRKIIDPIYGFKLTGKISPKDTIAAIQAKDDLPGDHVDEHPDFTIVRYKHSLKGDSYIGGFYTARSYGEGFNRVGGADGRFRISQTAVMSFHLLGSFSRSEGDDETNTDHALSLLYEWGNREWAAMAGYQDISPDFRIDSGFITRTGVRRLSLFGMYRIYPKSKFFQRIEPFYWSYHLYDTVHDMFETMNVLVLRFYLPASTQFRVDALLGNEIFAGQRFNRSGYGFRAQSQIVKQFFFTMMYRRTGSIYYDPSSPFQGYGQQAHGAFVFQPTDKLNFMLSLVYIDFFRDSDKEKLYDYTLLRSRNTFQVNKYLFLRAIVEYNFFRDRLTADLLASFTYIPGTVIHVGYGSAYEKLDWNGQNYIESERFLETKRGFFFKFSYLWRF